MTKTPRRPGGDPSRLLEALARDYMVYIDAYCNGPGCTVREVDFVVKDYDRDFIAHLTAGRWLFCPVCQTPLTVHAVRTRREQRGMEDRRARCSVNRQILQRAQGHGFMNATAFLNDALPPVAGTKTTAPDPAPHPRRPTRG